MGIIVLALVVWFLLFGGLEKTFKSIFGDGDAAKLFTYIAFGIIALVAYIVES